MALWVGGCLAAIPDISTVPADLVLPKLASGNPAAGKRVKQVHPDWKQTKVYHLLYLPKDWQPGKRYPVIVEYAGNGPYQNRFGDLSTGHPEGSKMGYGITAGRGFIWVCIPYLNSAGTRNVTQWWAINRPMIRSKLWLIAKRSSHGFANTTAEIPSALCSVGFLGAPSPVTISVYTMTRLPGCGGHSFRIAITTAYIAGAIPVRTRLRH